VFGLSSQEVLFGFFICVQIEDCGIQSYSEQNAPLTVHSRCLKTPIQSGWSVALSGDGKVVVVGAGGPQYYQFADEPEYVRVNHSPGISMASPSRLDLDPSVTMGHL
jgi:hypothetical protein